jgi:hypothetical protein
MTRNLVSFTLSFMILMEKCGFSSSPLWCARQSCIVYRFPWDTYCLMEDKCLRKGIRLGGSATQVFLQVFQMYAASVSAVSDVCYKCFIWILQK